MIVHGNKNYAVPVTLAAILVGFLLIISGYFPLAIVGAVLILLSFLVPFLRLGMKPNPPVGRSPDPTPSTTGTSPDEVARREDAVTPKRHDPAHRPGRR